MAWRGGAGRSCCCSHPSWPRWCSAPRPGPRLVPSLSYATMRNFSLLLVFLSPLLPRSNDTPPSPPTHRPFPSLSAIRGPAVLLEHDDGVRVKVLSAPPHRPRHPARLQAEGHPVQLSAVVAPCSPPNPRTPELSAPRGSQSPRRYSRSPARGGAGRGGVGWGWGGAVRGAYRI